MPLWVNVPLRFVGGLLVLSVMVSSARRYTSEEPLWAVALVGLVFLVLFTIDPIRRRRRSRRRDAEPRIARPVPAAAGLRSHARIRLRGAVDGQKPGGTGAARSTSDTVV